MKRNPYRTAVLLGAVSLVLGFVSPDVAVAAAGQPHYASLKADEVHVRKGPGEEYDVLWTYRSIGLPVEVTAEHEHWRRIRDSEGSEGWVHFRLLSALRSALVAPWQKGSEETPLLAADHEGARVVAKLERGVRVYVSQCDGQWCRVSVSNLAGWLPQNRLWGIYPDEKFK